MSDILLLSFIILFHFFSEKSAKKKKTFCFEKNFSFFKIYFQIICHWLLNHFYVASLKPLTDIPNVIHFIVIEN